MKRLHPRFRFEPRTPRGRTRASLAPVNPKPGSNFPPGQRKRPLGAAFDQQATPLNLPGRPKGLDRGGWFSEGGFPPADQKEKADHLDEGRTRGRGTETASPPTTPLTTPTAVGSTRLSQRPEPGPTGFPAGTRDALIKGVPRAVASRAGHRAYSGGDFFAARAKIVRAKQFFRPSKRS